MPSLTSSRLKDYCAGGLMFLLGSAAIIGGRGYAIGSLGHVGAGFFPVMLGVILVLIGLAIIATAPDIAPINHAPPATWQWRGCFLIALGIIAFAGLGRYGGLVPASFALVFISALADRRNTLGGAFVLALSVVGVAVLVFHWALQVQFPLFAWG